MKRDDLYFMTLAYHQAQKAYDAHEVPIGAVLIDQTGSVVARSYNQVEKKITQLAHAEMIVLARAAKKLKSWRLDGLTLYVTVQPCMMCLGALYLSRVSRIVYGVESPKYGMSLDGVMKPNEACSAYCKGIDTHEAKKKLGNIYQNLHTLVQCIHYEPAKNLLQLFFQKKRSRQDGKQNRVVKN